MKVLIVDDSRAMRMIVRRTLRQAGFEVDSVVEAENGARGLEQVEEHQPDLILSDWNMPEMSGMQFLRAFKEAGGNTPFGFITTESTPEMRAAASAAGALFILSKPFTPEAMRATIAPHIM
ncbi:MAG: two-component system chemotaxis response regulator CheY [Myxococcota bacterium]|jgi:two-component system chemotaxis response regulator CheY